MKGSLPILNGCLGSGLGTCSLSEVLGLWVGLGTPAGPLGDVCGVIQRETSAAWDDRGPSLNPCLDPHSRIYSFSRCRRISRMLQEAGYIIGAQ